MPIKINDPSPESNYTVNLGHIINMDPIMNGFSQESLGFLDNELMKGPIDEMVMEELMRNPIYPNSGVFSDSQHVHILSLNEIKQPPVEETLVVVMPPTGTMLSQEDYSGPYGFELNMTSGSKGNYVYSPLLKQVFIGMNNILMMEFKTSHQLDRGCHIRAVLVYTCTEFVCVPVVRCATHALDDDPLQEAHTRGEEDMCRCENFNNVGHVMKCSLQEAIYCYDKTSERHSVKVPVAQLQAGADCIKIPYSFSCKTSCPRGMQRKPVQIVFTLENEEGYVIGRKMLPVKICSCPKRDKDRQERDYRKAQQLNAATPSGSKRLAVPPPVNENINQPPLKSIKIEENKVVEEPLQNEEEKQKQARRTLLLNNSNNSSSNINPLNTNAMDDNFQRLLLNKVTNIENKLTNMENLMQRYEAERKETVDRLESLLYILQTKP